MSVTSRADRAKSPGRKKENAGQPKVAANPWKAFAGAWRDNPDFDALLKEIAELRRETDQAEREP